MNLAVWSLLSLAVVGGRAAPSNPTDAARIAALERNKVVARSLFEVVLSKGDWEGYRRIHTSEFRAHTTGVSASLDEDLAAAQEWRLAFPAVVVGVEHVVAEGDLVAVHWIAHGTNTGIGHGLPATGKKIRAGGITIFRMKDGRIDEEWGSMDSLQMRRQLGLIRSP